MVACDELEARFKSYADLSHAIRAYVHPKAIRADNRELFMRMVFNILVSNDDDHLRNHGFLLDAELGGWRLSPLYDVVPRPGIASERFLHLQVGTQGKLATLDNAISGHAMFIPERSDAVEAIARDWSQVSRWREHFESWGGSGRLIDQLARAFRSLDEVASPDLAHDIQRRATMP